LFEHLFLYPFERWDMDTADLDGDGDIDIFECAASEHVIWENLGEFNFAAHTFPNSHDCVGISLGDLDGDSDSDAFLSTTNSADEIWRNDGEFQFSVASHLDPITTSEASALVDIDNDSDLDILVAVRTLSTEKDNFEPTYAANIVYINEGNFSFTRHLEIGNNHSNSIATGDFDNDGDVDVFVTNGSNYGTDPLYKDEIWLNDGAGNFQIELLDPDPEWSWRAKSVDYDGDGITDILVMLNDGRIMIFLASPNDIEQAEAVYQEALDLYESGADRSTFNAYDSLSYAISLDPSHARAYYTRGVIAFWDLGDAQQAISDFSASILNDPTYALAYYGLGVVNYDLGNNQEAENALNQFMGLATVETDEISSAQEILEFLEN